MVDKHKATENKCQKKQTNKLSDLHSLWVTSRVEGQQPVKLELETLYFGRKKVLKILARKNLMWQLTIMIK